MAPLGLGCVPGHHRPVEPLLDIAAEAIRGQLGEVEGKNRHVGHFTPTEAPTEVAGELISLLKQAE